jgi:hypothetical protein
MMMVLVLVLVLVAVAVRHDVVPVPGLLDAHIGWVAANVEIDRLRRL